MSKRKKLTMKHFLCNLSLQGHDLKFIETRTLGIMTDGKYIKHIYKHVYECSKCGRTKFID